MAKLFDSSDSEEEVNLKTENEYAKKYDNWREKEELYKLEQKYGENPEISSSESEDDSDPEFSEVIEKDFLKTLALLKKKDPRIYDKNFEFFHNEEFEEKSKNIKESTSENHKLEEAKISKPKQREVKSLSEMFEASDSSGDEDEILKVASASEESNIKTDKLKDFLVGKVEHIDDEVEQDLEPLKQLWSDPNIDEKEKFLRDFVLEKKYLEDPDLEDSVVKDKLRDDENLDEDEKTIEEQKNFERAYNFRFEDPDPEFIKRYPRTMNAIRPKDDRRARKRAEVRARKDEEKKRKMDEIARMKALKLKEIQEKIAKIKEVTGNEELAFREEDIEGEFDPDEHDRRMKALFDSQYYQEADDEKPVFPDLDEELEIENWEHFEDESIERNIGPHCEDPDFIMDADYDPKKSRTTSLMDEIKETLGNKRRNRKRKSKLAEILALKKPKFDPINAEKSYSEFMEEYYKMDCEDVIGGDLPTRFKYREVVPNDFGLAVEEILLADDKELNKWVSLKKAVTYRPDFVEKSEINTYRLKGQDIELKKKIIPSLFSVEELEELIMEDENSPKKKKKNKNKWEITEAAKNTDKTARKTENTDEDAMGSKKRKISENTVVDAVHCLDEASSKKKRRRKKNKNKTEQESDENSKNHVSLEDDIHKNATNKNMDAENSEKSAEKDAKISNKKRKTSENDVKDAVHVNDETSSIKKRRKKKNKNKTAQNIEENSTKRDISAENNTDIKEKIEKKQHKSDKKAYNASKKTHDSQKNKNKHGVNKAKNKLKNKNGANKLKKNNTNKTNAANDSDLTLSSLSDERLKAFGLNPKKYRNFLKYKKQ